MLLATAAEPLVIARQQLLLRELLKACIERNGLFHLLQIPFIILGSVHSERFRIELRIFVYHDFKSECPLIFKHRVKVTQFNKASAIIYFVSGWVLFCADLAHVITVVVFATAKLALCLPSCTTFFGLQERSVILDHHENIFVDPEFKLFLVRFFRHLFTLKYALNMPINPFLHFHYGVIHAQVKIAR